MSQEEKKAKELILKYWNLPIHMNWVIDGVIIIEPDRHAYVVDAKEMALIAVEEIMKTIDYEEPRHSLTQMYWEKVKEHINNM